MKWIIRHLTSSNFLNSLFYWGCISCKYLFNHCLSTWDLLIRSWKISFRCRVELFGTFSFSLFVFFEVVNVMLYTFNVSLRTFNVLVYLLPSTPCFSLMLCLVGFLDFFQQHFGGSCILPCIMKLMIMARIYFWIIVIQNQFKINCFKIFFLENGKSSIIKSPAQRLL